MATAALDDWTKNLPAGYDGLLNASKAQAVSGTFDESKGVAGRVQSITSAGGPLMQAARTRAAQAMQKRGTLNTSLAGQAGEQAVIDSATPIASADAQLYQTQQLENQRAANEANRLNASLTAQIGTEGFRLGENRRQFDAGLSWDKDKFGQSLVEERRRFDASHGLDRDRLALSRDELTMRDRQFDATMGFNRDELSQRDRQFMQTLGLDRERLGLSRDELAQRDRQFDASLNLDRERVALSRDELAQRADQFAQSIGLDRERIGLSRDELAQRATQFAESLALDKERVGLTREDMAQRAEQFAQSLGLDRERLGLSRDELAQRAEQFMQTLGLDRQRLDLSREEMSQRDRQFATEQANRLTMANLDADTRLKLGEMESKYRSDISSNENISRAWGTMMEQIGQIQNNPDLESGAKNTLIENARAQFGQFAEFWKKASGGAVDVSDLLNFGPLPSAPSGGTAPNAGGYGGRPITERDLIAEANQP